METKFNFNSQVCTSKVQSEALLKLGLKKETADMNYTRLSRGDSWTLFIGKPLGYEDIPTEYLLPAWSLHRLWELYWSNKVVSDCLFGCGKHMSPYAKMIAMIEYDIEDGTFNKDYLEK